MKPACYLELQFWLLRVVAARNKIAISFTGALSEYSKVQARLCFSTPSRHSAAASRHVFWSHCWKSGVMVGAFLCGVSGEAIFSLSEDLVRHCLECADSLACEPHGPCQRGPGGTWSSPRCVSEVNGRPSFLTSGDVPHCEDRRIVVQKPLGPGRGL